MSGWHAVNKANPCPACGKPDWCAWSPDRKRLRCMRGGDAPEGMRRISSDAEGGAMYGFEDWTPEEASGSDWRGNRKPTPASKPSNAHKRPRIDAERLHAEAVARLTSERLAALVDALGVPAEAVRTLCPGWCDAEHLRAMGAYGAGWDRGYPDGAYAFPERDGAGRMVGLGLRPLDGRKGAPSREKTGLRRALTVPSGTDLSAPLVVVCEGASDAAAGVAMGLQAVARPSNKAGADDLADLLRDARGVLVLGENDRRTDERGAEQWPGRDGAESVARTLAERWGRPVRWCMPPANAKDLRAFYHEHGEAGGALLRAHFDLFAHSVEPSNQDKMRFDRIDTPANETNPDALRDVPLGELGPSEPPDWIWRGYAARGCITLFSAAPKAGKTTLIRSILKDLYGGGGMVGRPPLEAPTLIVSEESAGQWSRHRDAFGLDPDLIRVIASPFMAKPTAAQWEDAIQRIAGRVEELGAAVVVLDTLSNLWPVRDENAAAEVNAALMPIRRITRTGAAVILVHHDRKGGGAFGEGARGSNAIAGFPDAIITLTRFRPEEETDTRRRLSYQGRFDDTEAEVILDFSGDGYSVSGRPAEVKADDLMRLIGNALPEDGAQVDFDAIHAEVRESVGKTRLRELLAEGAKAGRWNRSGTGKKGDAHMFSRSKCVSIAADSIRTKRITGDDDGWRDVGAA
ncbi:MAG: AAA family ATPase [bacterium]|nr:AAA family ATPase [bacterium]